jgi:hypothetical protein
MEMLNINNKMNRIVYLLLFFSTVSLAQDSILYDCVGNDVTEIIDWVGDGFCDDGSYSWDGNDVYFNCEEFNFDEGDCVPQEQIPGCIDVNALNYVPEATLDDGSCIYPFFNDFVWGCTDPEAINFNPWAEIDFNCLTNVCNDDQSLITIEVTLDQYPSETGWILTDVSNGQPIKAVSANSYNYNQAYSTISYNVCIPETGVEFILSDTYGDGMESSNWGSEDGDVVILGDDLPCGDLDTLWSLDSANFGSAAYSGVIYLDVCEDPMVFGCTDPNYVEYNPEANVDNETCVNLHKLGCIDTSAFNFDTLATIEEIIPTCDYTLIIEDDAGDGWGGCYLGIAQEDSVIGEYYMEPGFFSKEYTIQLDTDKPVSVYYFEISFGQQPIEELQFSSMQNSFRLINSDGVLLTQGGVHPFANNGAGALQPHKGPFWNKYTATPYCGNYCIPKVYGCTDSLAYNFDSLANTNVGCIEAIIGCTNELAFNYDSLANVDDGQCTAIVYGCMENDAWNYNYLANIEDSSCLYFGCTDTIALNYDSTANVNNSSCVYPVYGCTNPIAFNYDVEANVNDGSCVPVILGCMDVTMFNYNEEANTAIDNCIPFVFGCTDITAYNFDPLANTDNESCIPIIPGCTDPIAFNYNEEANQEDFSCVDVVLGCTDSLAFNYDPLANTNNDACINVAEGCMDQLAHNYDEFANTENGSCLYDAGCIDGPGNPYWLNDTCYAWVIMVDSYCCNTEWDDKCQELYWKCGGDSELDVRDLMRTADIAIYPVPMGDEVNILTKGKVTIRIYDIQGKLIKHVRQKQTIKGLNTLNVKYIPSGLYNISVTYDNKTITKQVVKR